MDHGGDYLDYLRPFAIHALAANSHRPVTSELVRTYVESEFGLVIPSRTIAIVLRRLSRSSEPIRRRDGAYHVEGSLSTTSLDQNRAVAEGHIGAVLADLREYSLRSGRTIDSDDRAVAAITAFLSKFDVSCLRSYLRGTALPSLHDSPEKKDVVLVSSYVRNIQRSQPDRFESFMVVVQGHMLANALLCPDLSKVGQTYRNAVFLLDTPLLIQCLGLEGQDVRRSTVELVALSKNLGASIAMFSHSREEMEDVIRAAAEHISSRNERSRIVIEAQKRGTSKSDLLLQVRKMDESLSALGIVVERTPRYQPRFQIDEMAFEMHLGREVRYHNPKARLRDIESVRSIYTLRRGRNSREIEKTRAVMVTDNAGFADAALAYQRDVEESRQLPAVVSDTSLANDAWLRAPMGASDLPRARVLALSYGALRPTEEVWHRYMEEIDLLESRGSISVRDLQLLRSDPSVSGRLMYATAGDATAVTKETARVLLGRVKAELQAESDAEIDKERETRRSVERGRAEARERVSAMIGATYWSCGRRARLSACVMEVILAAGVLGSATGSFAEGTIAALVAGAGAVVWAVVSNWWGWSVRGVCLRLRKWLWLLLFRRRLSESGLTADEIDAAVGEWGGKEAEGEYRARVRDGSDAGSRR